ncbi:hypothetical protein H4W33_003900 [Kibdelosporangium phytohabitans]|nr:hypothetical protein [Kibdelosporangium phytohabitans]
MPGAVPVVRLVRLVDDGCDGVAGGSGRVDDHLVAASGEVVVHRAAGRLAVRQHRVETRSGHAVLPHERDCADEHPLSSLAWFPAHAHLPRFYASGIGIFAQFPCSVFLAWNKLSLAGADLWAGALLVFFLSCALDPLFSVAWVLLPDGLPEATTRVKRSVWLSLCVALRGRTSGHVWFGLRPGRRAGAPTKPSSALARPPVAVGYRSSCSAGSVLRALAVVGWFLRCALAARGKFLRCVLVGPGHQGLA